MLHHFLTDKRDELIARITKKVAARTAPRPTDEELTRGIPLFVDQFVETLEVVERGGQGGDRAAARHGTLMLGLGFTMEQVTRDCLHVRQAVTELLLEQGAPLTAEELRLLYRCLDGVTVHAVTEYGRLREQSIARDGIERMGFLVHELRNRLGTAVLSLGLLRSGKAPIHGSVGALLERSLKALGDLTDRALAEVRLEASPPRRERILMTELLDEMEVTGSVDASARGVHLTVEPVDDGLAIEADREVLAAAVANLLQNALKFTRATGTVRLVTHTTADRVLIDIEDECGGLPDGKNEGLFRPFEQCGADRTGLGLGLSISRKGVHESGGEVHVRNMPGKGCVFTVDLPRMRGLRLIRGDLGAASPLFIEHGDAG
jgi:signal transduction histidine kinase